METNSGNLWKLISRPVVFLLAFLSFACLLGTFYGFWPMHVFACWIFPPTLLLLTLIAYATRHQAAGASMWIVEGALAGLVAAVAYDLYRLPFVLNGAPLFTVFTKFGQLLLNRTEPHWLVQLVGWTYHFSNGAALGIMFLALVRHPRPRTLFWGAVAWALFIETLLLLTPYTTFLGLKLDGRFIFLTASAHLIFGIVLGLWSCRRLSLGGKLTV